MKLPRDVSGEALARALERFGDRITRQTGRHIRLTLDQPPQRAAGRLRMSKEQLLTALKL